MDFKSYKIAEGFWNIEQNNGGVRCFLFEGNDEAMLVDTGFGGDLKSVCDKLTDKPIFVVSTHSDGDHIGCDHQFTKRYLHPAEMDAYERRNGRPANALPIWEGDVIDLGTFAFEVILLPGHTPGSIVLLERSKRFLIGGDTVQGGEIFMFGDGRNLNAYIASMEKLIQISSAFDIIYGSHAQLELPFTLVTTLLTVARKLHDGELVGTREGIPEFAPETTLLYKYENVSFIA